MYVRNGYDGDSETVNVLAIHTALKRWIATEIRWYRNVVSRGSAVQSVALLPISAMRLWASSDKGPRVSTAIGKNHVSDGESTVLGRLSRRRGRRSTSCLQRILRHVGCCQCVSNCHIPCGTAPRLPWYQRQAIGSLSVVSAETLGLLDCWCFCPNQGAVNQVVEPSMELISAWLLLAWQRMLAERWEDTPWRRRSSSEPRRLHNPGGDRRPRVWRCHRGEDHNRWSEECEASRRCEVLPPPTI